MKNYSQIYTSFLVIVFCTCKGQHKTDPPKENINTKIKDETKIQGPDRITRNIIQDRKGNIWMASWAGIFKYDGKSFTNITSKVSSARFFSIIEDRKGNLWFGSIGSGVYYYDGKSFQNFTTKDGLLNNDVCSIYEDKKGNIWFGVSGGASRYNGKSFRNYIINEDVMNEDWTGKTFPYRTPYGVSSIIEDKKGKFWFATNDNTFVYDGKTFAVFTHKQKPFKKVSSIIEDKKGNIWLGGPDGLWCFNGHTFTNFAQKTVGSIIEDKRGNIWTSSERNSSRDLEALNLKDGKLLSNQTWALSRYDQNSLFNKRPTVTEITYQPLIFGIVEDDKGSIWFGALDGVYRYDGNTITDFKGKEVGK